MALSRASRKRNRQRAKERAAKAAEAGELRIAQEQSIGDQQAGTTNVQWKYFDEYDRDNNGFLDKGELQVFCVENLALSESDADQVFATWDTVTDACALHS